MRWWYRYLKQFYYRLWSFRCVCVRVFILNSYCSFIFNVDRLSEFINLRQRAVRDSFVRPNGSVSISATVIYLCFWSERPFHFVAFVINWKSTLHWTTQTQQEKVFQTHVAPPPECVCVYTQFPRVFLTGKITSLIQAAQEQCYYFSLKRTLWALKRHFSTFTFS